jgi:hypothetical protein
MALLLACKGVAIGTLPIWRDGYWEDAAMASSSLEQF